MNKCYLVFSHEGKHEFDLTVEETKEGKQFTLSYSHGSQWGSDCRGEKLIVLLDTGNGIKITPKFNDMDYSEADALRLVLNFDIAISDNPANKTPYKIIEAANTLEL